jgi:pyruvate dehydrogenase E1 component alpha subunit
MIRFFGHFEGDAQTYRASGEVDDIRANHDCLKSFSKTVTASGVLYQADLEACDTDVLSLIEEAVSTAKAAELPTEVDLLTDVYVNY